MNPKPPSLPDLDDEEFAARLKPLETAVLPQPEPAIRRSANPDDRNSGYSERWRPENARAENEMELLVRNSVSPEGMDPVNPDIRSTRSMDDRNAGDPGAGRDTPPVFRTSGDREIRKSGLVGAAERLAVIEQIRGPKRRFEYLIPARVGDALAEDAARQGKSATIRLLEVLREAGYPVIPEDLMDLRRERRR
jgi:hypothetical protein